jgi:predicted AAA+ superfamily ATPase
MIPRLVEDYVYETMVRLHKAIMIMGARQVGKTTLLQALQKRLESQGEAVRYPIFKVNEAGNRRPQGFHKDESPG